MAAAYDDFECRLRERLLTIAEEIEAAKESGRASMADPANKVGRALAAQQIKIKALLQDQNNAIIVTMTSLLADDHVIVEKRC